MVDCIEHCNHIHKVHNHLHSNNEWQTKDIDDDNIRASCDGNQIVNAISKLIWEMEHEGAVE